MIPAAYSFDLVVLEPELERQIGAIAKLTGVTRSDVIQECVRDRLMGGTFRAPFPVKQGPGRQPGGIGTQSAGQRPGEGRVEVAYVRQGEVSCVQHQGTAPQPPAKSADTFQHQRTQLSQGSSDQSLGSSGRATPRLGSPLSRAATCEPSADGSAARSMRPPTSGPSCSPSPQTQSGSCTNE